MAAQFTITYRDGRTVEGRFSPRALRALSRYQAAHEGDADKNIMATLAGAHAELRIDEGLEEWSDTILDYEEATVPTTAATTSPELSPPSPPPSE